MLTDTDRDHTRRLAAALATLIRDMITPEMIERVLVFLVETGSAAMEAAEAGESDDE